MIGQQQIYQFQNFIVQWYQNYGRHDLPWRKTTDPYQILLSELMLQQTQVDRVIPKFRQFITTFPTVQSLATADFKSVLKAWQGLGYNRRALFLHRLSQIITKTAEGSFPKTEAKLKSLPGIGNYTAAAIMTFAYNQPTLVIETNIRTVYLYHFFPNQTAISDLELIPFISTTKDDSQPRTWYSALMDYGSYLKTVIPNPTRQSRQYMKQSRFIGSLRQVRGQVLKILTLRDGLSLTDLKQTLTASIALDDKKLIQSLQQLETEGFIYQKGNRFHVQTKTTL